MTDRDRATLAGLGLLALAGAMPHPSGAEVAVGSSQAAGWEAALRRARQVDVNTAGIAELERLPQVGPTLAQRLVADRAAHGPFRTRQDLRRVRGIGEKTIEAIERYMKIVDE